MSEIIDVTFDAVLLEDVVFEFDIAARNLREVMGVIADDMVGMVEENFATEGASSPSGAWTPLAESTIRRRRKQGRGAKILQDTGRMAGSVESDYGDNFAQAYSNAEYAVFHVSKEPREVIPLRDFLDIDMEELERQAEEDLLAEIVGG